MLYKKKIIKHTHKHIHTVYYTTRYYRPFKIYEAKQNTKPHKLYLNASRCQNLICKNNNLKTKGEATEKMLEANDTTRLTRRP